MNHEIDAAGIGRTVLWVYGLAWNELQSTPQHINKLSEHLIRIEREQARIPA